MGDGNKRPGAGRQTEEKRARAPNQIMKKESGGPTAAQKKYGQVEERT